MKLINLAVLALASLNLVSSRAINEKRAINDKERCNSQLCYWVSGPRGGTATLVGFGENNKNHKSLTVPRTVVFEGYTYYINSVGLNAFSSDSNLQEVTVSSGISKLSLSHNAFASCPNLKRVVLNSPTVSETDTTPFSSPNNNIVFLGSGVKTFTDDQAKKLIKQFSNISSIEIKDYSKIDDYHKKVALFELAKTLSQYLRISDNTDSGNALTALKVKFATSDGYARLYRILAIAMGIPAKDILVGQDGKGKYFNYVKVDGYWYNVDITSYPYRLYTEYYIVEWKRPFFVDKDTHKDIIETTVNPANWYVMFSNYGYADEFRGQQTYDIFDQYLKQNKLGSRK